MGLERAVSAGKAVVLSHRKHLLWEPGRAGRSPASFHLCGNNPRYSLQEGSSHSASTAPRISVSLGKSPSPAFPRCPIRADLCCREGCGEAAVACRALCNITGHESGGRGRSEVIKCFRLYSRAVGRSWETSQRSDPLVTGSGEVRWEYPG